jgi:hypothetical protein
MSEHETQIRELDKKITVLSDTFARLRKGTTIQDLLRIIRNPRYTTRAELLFTEAMVELMQAQVNTIDSVLEYWRVMPSVMSNSHIPLEALWKCRSNQISLSRDKLKHLYGCGECLGALCICKISKTIAAAVKHLKQGKPKLHKPYQTALKAVAVRASTI